MIRSIFTCLLCIITTQGFTQTLTSSNLPIVIINTGGNEILDEPKIDADLKIIYQEDGSRNMLSTNQYHFDGKIGIELRGQSSQGVFPKKGFGIETRDGLGADLNVSLFGMPKESDWVIHSPYSDKSLIRNALSYHFAGQIMAYAPRIQLCELILNGEYYGIVLFTERIKRDKDRVDISKLKSDEISGDDLTGGYILKFDKSSSEEVGWESPYLPLEGAEQRTRFIYHYPKHDDIVPEQKAYIRSFITDFENALMSEDFKDPNIGYKKYIDPTTFIDQMIINEMTRNVDAYRLSTFMYKDKDSNDSRLKLGPVWDYNLAIGNANYCEGSSISGWAWDFNDICPGDYWLNHFWWERLLEDPDFANQFTERWASLRQGQFSNENLIAVVDSMTTLLSEAQVRNFQRWPVLGDWVWPNNFVGGNYPIEVTYLKNWLIDRAEWMDGHINQVTDATEQALLSSEVINVYPNPATEEVIFDVLREDMDDYFIEVYDANARKIYQSEFINSPGKLVWKTESANGLYYYVLRTKEKIETSGKVQVVK